MMAERKLGVQYRNARNHMSDAIGLRQHPKLAMSHTFASRRLQRVNAWCGLVQTAITRTKKSEVLCLCRTVFGAGAIPTFRPPHPLVPLSGSQPRSEHPSSIPANHCTYIYYPSPAHFHHSLSSVRHVQPCLRHTKAARYQAQYAILSFTTYSQHVEEPSIPLSRSHRLPRGDNHSIDLRCNSNAGSVLSAACRGYNSTFSQTG